jgi:hypothetical protein
MIEQPSVCGKPSFCNWVESIEENQVIDEHNEDRD